jgi:integrase
VGEHRLASVIFPWSSQNWEDFGCGFSGGASDQQPDSHLPVELGSGKNLGRLWEDFGGQGIMKLTVTTVKTAELERGKSETIFFDDDIPGFGLRLREGGSKNFVFQYKLGGKGGKHRRMALGKATAVTIGDARKTAEKLYARVRLGEDPATDKVEAQRQASETFRPSVEEFLEVLRERYRPRAFKEIERHLTKHAKPLHQMQVAKIAHRDIADLIVSVTKQSGPVTANRLRTSLSTFFAWLIQRGRAPANPVINVEKNPEKSRDRVLAPAELRLIWNALGDDQYGAIVKLLALTGQRASEIASLHRDEVHDEQIILPPERTKNGRPHVVPLSPIAMQIIEGQRGDNGRDFVFGRGEGAGFSGWSKSKERLDRAVAEANGGKPIAPWVPHDLRRTLATYLGGGLPEHQLKKLPPKDRDAASGLGIEPHVIEAVLNHVSGTKAGIVGVYQRGTYPREKKAALDLWADRLLAIVEGRESNITPLRRDA